MAVISFMEELWGRRVCENFSEGWTEPRVSLLQRSNPVWSDIASGSFIKLQLLLRSPWVWQRHSHMSLHGLVTAPLENSQCLDTKRSTNHPPPREEDVCFILFVPMVFLFSDFLGYCTVFIPCFYLWTNRIASLDGAGVCSAGTSAGSLTCSQKQPCMEQEHLTHHRGMHEAQLACISLI